MMSMDGGGWFRWWWVAALIGFPALILGFSWVVMSLWNAILPGVFGIKPLSYWQAMGLLVLSRILFGGLGHGGPRRHWRKERCVENRIHQALHEDETNQETDKP